MAWDVVYYRNRAGSVPGAEFLEDRRACPPSVAATMFSVLQAVAEAPPPKFSGGGYWEAMHGEMAGFYEIRKGGPPNRTQYRLFCLLDNADLAELRRRHLPGPAIVVLAGMSKPWMTTFGAGDYSAVKALGEDYLATVPRRIGV